MGVLKAIEILGERSGLDERPNLDALGPELKAAFEERNIEEIERLLGSRSNIVMFLIPADDDDSDDKQPDDDDGEEKPEKDVLAG